MASISIIGTGNMGSGLQKLFTNASGVQVNLVAHSEVSTAEFGDIVILPVPYPAVLDLVKENSDKLQGKIVVDITNPVDFSNMNRIIPSAGSAAAEIAALVPDAKVVKAFNTNFAATLSAGNLNGQPLSVLIAGDDNAAKQNLSDIVSSTGANVFDAGKMQNATDLEGIGHLQIALAAGEKISWAGGFTLNK